MCMHFLCTGKKSEFLMDGFPDCWCTIRSEFLYLKTCQRRFNPRRSLVTELLYGGETCCHRKFWEPFLLFCSRGTIGMRGEKNWPLGFCTMTRGKKAGTYGVSAEKLRAAGNISTQKKCDHRGDLKTQRGARGPRCHLQSNKLWHI